MILRIDTSTNEYIRLELLKDSDIIERLEVEAKYKQSEKLLVSIDEILNKNKINKKDLTKIIVNNEGSGFSALRIGVVVANALAYGLGIGVFDQEGGSIQMGDYQQVIPKYSQEPNIG